MKYLRGYGKFFYAEDEGFAGHLIDESSIRITEIEAGETLSLSDCEDFTCIIDSALNDNHKVNTDDVYWFEMFRSIDGKELLLTELYSVGDDLQIKEYIITKPF